MADGIKHSPYLWILKKLNRKFSYSSTEQLFDLFKLSESWGVNEETKKILDEIFNR